MIIDPSALLAIITSEPQRPRFLEAIENAPTVSMSTASWFECCIVVDNHANPLVARRFDALVEAAGIELVPVSAEHARVARAAYRDFGKGSSSVARLNFGDCFSYALAKVTDEPLLFKGDDFGHTDVRAAV